MSPQKFGGPWTEQKLAAVEAYLKAYLKIFTANPIASQLTRHYVDAFAGSGWRQWAEDEPQLWTDEEGDALRFAEGSVRKVLGLKEAFHRYWLVEKNSKHAADLEAMIGNDFPARAANCTVVCRDANDFLLDWLARLGAKDRVVIFLDPYGMAVRWTTLEKLARSRKVDLWMLFPSASVLRMLPHAGPPSEAWARRLTQLFGTEDWRDEFYPKDVIMDLFDSIEQTQRKVDSSSVADFMLRRLGEVFAGVAPKALVLYNSRRSPLFHLVFAAANPKGAKPAIRIASHIIGTS